MASQKERSAQLREEKLRLHQAALVRLLQDFETANPIDSDEMDILVRQFYAYQRDRIRQDNRLRALRKMGKSSKSIEWLAEQSRLLEETTKRMITVAAKRIPLCQWAMTITGIGPVIAAGLYAHVHPHITPYAGGVWRYFGMDPTVQWRKGEKRPWNADAKRLAWNIGQAFIKTGDKDSLYYQVYLKRKEREWRKNAAGEYAGIASDLKNRVGKSTDAYAWNSGKFVIHPGEEFEQWVAGGMQATKIPKRVAQDGQGVPMLAPAHILRRAIRVAVKLFLSHVHAVAYYLLYEEAPPLPYVVEWGGHRRVILPPNLDKFPELEGFAISYMKNAEDNLDKIFAVGS